MATKKEKCFQRHQIETKITDKKAMTMKKKELTDNCERNEMKEPTWAEITGEAVMVVNNSNGVVVGLVVSQNALNGIQGGLCHKPNHPFGHRIPTCNQNPKFATKGDSNNFISINIENLYI